MTDFRLSACLLETPVYSTVQFLYDSKGKATICLLQLQWCCVMHTEPAYSYSMVQKTDTLCLYALISSNIDRFSNLFHCQNQQNICNNTVTKDPTTPQVCRYTTL